MRAMSECLPAQLVGRKRKEKGIQHRERSGNVAKLILGYVAVASLGRVLIVQTEFVGVHKWLRLATTTVQDPDSRNPIPTVVSFSGPGLPQCGP